MTSDITRVSDAVDHHLVARATELRPLIAEHAVRTEAERQVVPEVIDALEGAGLFEVMVPERVGGLGATMATQLAVAAELGRACPSTAWVQAILNVTTWASSRTPAGAELFELAADGRRPRVCGVIAPTGTATPVDGGYLLSGKWPFSSGSFCANWYSAGVLIADEQGEVIDAGAALVPMGDLSIEDSWYVAGMSGTSSNTVVADNVFIPARRITHFSNVERVADSPQDRWPLGSVLALVLVGPLLGAARACADVVVEKSPAKAISYTSYAHITDSMAAITETARALLDIDSAWLHAFQAASYIDAVGAGAPPDPVEEGRLRGQCGYLLERLRTGVDTLLTVGGAGSFANVNSMQRYWRDLNVGSRHAFLTTNVSLETYGRALFGIEPTLMLV